ncbi:MAG: EAL domain-containing protein [Blautia sp.]
MAIHYRSGMPSVLVNCVCKIYIVSLIWGAWSALIYVVTDLLCEKEHRKLIRRFVLFTLVQSVVIFLLPIYIFQEGSQVYTYGPSVLGVYTFVGLYIIATLIVTHIFRNKLNPRRRFAIILWMLIWMASAVFQLINNALLVVGFASAVGMLILFVIMENPEANLERSLGCFNSYALTEYVKQLYERKKEFSVLEISFENTDILEEHGDADEILTKILQISRRYDDILVFKNINLGLIIISEKTEKLERLGEEILSYCSRIEMVGSLIMPILVVQAGILSYMEELFHFFAFVRAECSDQKGTMIFAREEMVKKYQEQYLVEREIREALLEDRVEVFLQPIYSNREKSFTSAEALVRIRKRNGELMSPGVFIPVAEASGQILELGERVFEKVCGILKETDVVKLGIHYIEVNLSVIQCEKADLSERLISIVEKYQIDPGRINLEITETASVSARNTLLDNMKKLIEYGFTFSLDDFGKGESNLMYVVEMPVSIVKLDYDLSKAFFHSEKARHVVRAVINMAHGMELKLVAEGIETEEEIEGMNVEGIDYIQGFYYARPLPVTEFLEFLK